ncbi:MAG: sugar kinase [Candidatus Thermofonsia Clade 1 bacterium]|jgi:2-dehydro-3-deoxygluconokinase|uniref:Sugar kinase n=1 Tax=Candidatus Thermofonsia Clade 1 bacterium TaxID=2364210 RepID=A0A2M8PDB5_9CHLR|nr:MAG: sugar kinase [Candidatus Thermofonsia Clade 1 bacterium]RMF51498.1 MAG: sugar kinase [Chloroflexota bacterium]
MAALDLFTFGEALLRLSAPEPLRLEQAAALEVHVAGAESNVAIALARLGKQVAWFSRLPDAPLGQLVLNFIRQHGVEVSDVISASEERLGLLFLERGMPPRPTRVWYDRAHSAASRLQPSDLPIERLASARWLHLTGITPALSDSCLATCHAAVAQAKQHRVKIAFDVNYRSLLWSPQRAREALSPFCAAADLVFIASRDAATVFEMHGNATTQAENLQRLWSGTVIVTDGERGAVAHGAEGTLTCAAYPTRMVERLGVGDAFAAGVLCRVMEEAPLAEALRFGAAMAALKLSMGGDVALVRRDEVEALIAGDSAPLHR